MITYTQPTGLWVPLITPFNGGKIDEVSLRRLIQHYASKDISGIILSATTGEGQLLSYRELELLAQVSAVTLSEMNVDLPLFLGLSGSDPKKLVEQVIATASWPIDGYLVSGPNYLRPSQQGVLQYFELIAQSTDKPILVYNIPYRTGVNIENETMLKLAELPNVVGVKDCCGSAEQSYELLRTAPEGFSVLTGEDPFFYNAMVHGAPGAILTGAHVLVDDHLQIMADIQNGKQATALALWNKVAHIPSLLFAEPSPAPVKYWLWKQGLINSTEVRVPFMSLSDALGARIDAEIIVMRKP